MHMYAYVCFGLSYVISFLLDRLNITTVTSKNRITTSATKDDAGFSIRRSDSGVSSMSTNSMLSGLSATRFDDKVNMALSLCDQPLGNDESKVC